MFIGGIHAEKSDDGNLCSIVKTVYLFTTVRTANSMLTSRYLFNPTSWDQCNNTDSNNECYIAGMM